jgi:hypothetical protein
MDQVIEGLFTIIRGLDQEQRAQLFRKLLSQVVLSKDQQDILVIESRRHEPSLPLEEVCERIHNKKRKK